jgi:hypothetical protein
MKSAALLIAGDGVAGSPSDQIDVDISGYSAPVGGLPLLIRAGTVISPGRCR